MFLKKPFVSYSEGAVPQRTEKIKIKDKYLPERPTFLMLSLGIAVCVRVSVGKNVAP